jgi:hypothetical protein
VTAPNVAGLIAEPDRLRVFAAIALGARTAADIRRTIELSDSVVEQALRRLLRGGLITHGPDGYDIDHDMLHASARAHPQPEPESFGTDDVTKESVLRTFVAGGRLIDFPAQWEKKIVVLEYLADRDLAPGHRYPESEINEILQAWCTAAPIDHVSVRRYLVDAGVVVRENGEYRLP